MVLDRLENADQLREEVRELFAFDACTTFLFNDVLTVVKNHANSRLAM